MDYGKHTDDMINREIAIKKGLIPRDSHTFHNSAEMTADYATDMNAAAELLRECWGELLWDGEGWHVEVAGYLYAMHPTNPARAICEVWLQWRDGQKS